MGVNNLTLGEDSPVEEHLKINDTPSVMNTSSEFIDDSSVIKLRTKTRKENK